MGVTLGIRMALLGQRGHLFQWVPVCLGIGVGLYFLAKTEPSTGVFWAAMVLGAGGCVIALRSSAVVAPFFWALTLVIAGGVLASARAHLIAGPVIFGRYYGPVEGTIVGIDRSASDRLRLTLSDVVLSDVPDKKVPLRVRVTLHGNQGFAHFRPGLRIILTAHLSPPSGPTEPNGFDFQRHAWFLRLGAVGYTRAPVLAIAAPKNGQFLFKIRMGMSRVIQNRVAGEAGGFAAAVTTGDRSGISQDTMKILRVSNLAHLLAISGLHMGLLAGFVFASVRVSLSLFPSVAMRVPTKKIAAVLALMAALGYLGLSGGNVATQRAFVMSAVALGAVMVDRRAISLRAVALAASIVLVLRPESITGPGFQMSFAATTALVAVFGLLRGHRNWLGPRWLRPISTVVLTSFVAGLATAPIAAAHFNQFAHYGLLANLLSVPLMGAVIIPAAVLAGLLAPIGLEGVGLWIMGLGLRWILDVAHWVSALDGARGTVISPPQSVVPLLAIGFCVLVLWQGRLRFMGAAPILLASVFWTTSQRPSVLIADTGGLVGVMSPEGRVLSKSRASKFVASNWLENDGDSVTQATAAGRSEKYETTPKTTGIWRYDLGGWQVIHLTTQRSMDVFDTCLAKDILVFSGKVDRPLPCQVMDQAALRDTGAIAISKTPDGWHLVSARGKSGARPWNIRQPFVRKRRFQ